MSAQSLWFAGVATARTADQVRQSLIRAKVIPVPLYPALLPGPLEDEATTTLKHGKHDFDVVYTLRNPVRGGDAVALDFSRAGAGSLSQSLLEERQLGYQPVRQRFSGIDAYRMRFPDSFGYMWLKAGFAYGVFEYIGTNESWMFLRRFIGALVPLDYDVHWSGACAGGGTVRLFYTESSPLLHLRATGAFVDTSSYVDSLGEHVSSDFRARVAGGQATGTFSASGDFTPSGGGSRCGTGRLTWSAAEIH
jgi:hypothetical protein